MNWLWFKFLYCVFTLLLWLLLRTSSFWFRFSVFKNINDKISYFCVLPLNKLVAKLLWSMIKDKTICAASGISKLQNESMTIVFLCSVCAFLACFHIAFCFIGLKCIFVYVFESRHWFRVYAHLPKIVGILFDLYRINTHINNIADVIRSNTVHFDRYFCLPSRTILRFPRISKYRSVILVEVFLSLSTRKKREIKNIPKTVWIWCCKIQHVFLIDSFCLCSFRIYTGNE